MIVGQRHLNNDELKKALNTRASLNKFIRAGIPKILQHNEQIVENQRYITALQIRNMKDLNFNHKMNIVNEIIEEVTINGAINTLYDLEDILASIDFDLLLRSLFNEELKAYERSMGEDVSTEGP